MLLASQRVCPVRPHLSGSRFGPLRSFHTLLPRPARGTNAFSRKSFPRHSSENTRIGGVHSRPQPVVEEIVTSSLPCLITDSFPLTPLESALARALGRNPFRINTYKTSQICIKTKDFNPIRMNTSKTPQPALKTKDFKSTRMNTSATSNRNPFRIRTSKKEEGRGVPTTLNPLVPLQYCAHGARIRPGAETVPLLPVSKRIERHTG